MSLSTTQYGYIVDPMVPFTDDKGKTIKNGFIRVFMAGTSTPVITYRNYDGATNQEKIELDNSGRVKHNVIGSKGSLYKVVVYNILHSQENPLLTVDKIAVLGSSINATGATIVTGLDSVTVPEENFLKATVEGTGVELAIDPTEVTSEVSTIGAAETAAPDYVVPLLEKTGTEDSKKISLANLFKFALDWISRLATTVTSFASGDFIAVSNTTIGARKMSKDTLLELTAQNALAGNVAPAFDPTKPNDEGGYAYYAGTNVTHDGKNYVFIVNHSSGAWNPAEVEQRPLSEGINTEGVGEAVANWLDEHPEATTTVEDGSLTEAKLSDDLKLKTIKDYVTPEMYGAVGNGSANDTTAVQNAIDSGKVVVLSKGKNYKCYQLTIPDKVTILGKGATLTCSSDSGNFIVRANDANNVTIRGVHIKAPSLSGATCFAFGEGCCFWILEELLIENFTVAFSSVTTFWFNSFRNVRVNKCVSGFVGYGRINISNIFDTVYFSSTTGYCIDFDTWKMNLFQNCAFESKQGPWARLYGENNGIRFVSTNFEYARLNDGAAGIVISSTSNITFEDCYFHSCDRKDENYTDTALFELNGPCSVEFRKSYIFGNNINNYFRIGNPSEDTDEKIVYFDWETLKPYLNSFSLKIGSEKIIFNVKGLIKSASRPPLTSVFNGGMWFDTANKKFYYMVDGTYQEVDHNLSNTLSALSSFVNNNYYLARQGTTGTSGWKKVLLSSQTENNPDVAASFDEASATYKHTDLEYQPSSGTLKTKEFSENGVLLKDKYLGKPSSNPASGTYTLKIIDGTIQWVQDA